MKNRSTKYIRLFFALGYSVFFSEMEAVLPPPDGGYPGGNTAEGQSALFSLTTGTFNTAVGFFSLRNNTEGQFNTATGAGALLANTADRNTATGAAALLSNTTGYRNTAVGAFALSSNTEAGSNTAIGTSALQNNSTGGGNTAIGDGALGSNTIGYFNSAIGYAALANNITGVGNTANGGSALLHNISGGGNTATGDNALIGNTVGTSNTANGALALVANTTGNNNTAIGDYALFNTTNSANTAVGYHALENNTTGNNNIALGAGAGSNAATAHNVICIGTAGQNTSDSFYVGNVFETSIDPDNLPVLIDVTGRLGTQSSSRRFKDNIQPMDKASEAILALKPVTFHYKNDPKCSPRFGLIAEQVAAVHPELVALDKDGEPYTVRYDQINAMLLNEFLKEHKRVEAQQGKIENQEATIAELKSTAARQQKGMELLTAQFKEQAARIQEASLQIGIKGPAVQLAGSGN